MSNRLIQLLSSLRRDEQGVVAVEFAIVAPVLISILLGIVLIGGHIIERSAAERAAIELLHLSTQFDNTGPSSNEETALQNAFEVMARESDADNYRVIITHFERDLGVADEKWTHEFGTWSRSSNVESGGVLDVSSAAALIPNNGDGLVSVEVYRRNLRFDLSRFINGGDATTIETIRYGLTR
ncbi:MAG: hypothetical protein Alpg2KO_16780 [Alphaproteobacteria bacterium]